jgi:hypothetical protein
VESAKKLALSKTGHLLILTAIVWLVFARTLSSYFLADDFGEIAYASHIFAGSYNLLWSDFTSNFMQVPGMAVWRPWLMVSLFTDFCIWRANPLGFYLTNLLSYNVVVILFYLLIRNLTQGSQAIKGAVAALLASALFAVSPLHCESVSWVVGRVDIICAVFYLACLNSYLIAERAFASGQKKRGKQLIALAIVAFWLAMWCKEMAIGAPVMVTTIVLLFGQRPLAWKNTWQIVAPIWISTIVYFVLRYMALGTILGGYVQGIGDSQAANALSRWLDLDTVKRLFFPLAHNIFGDNPWQFLALQLLYTVLLSLIFLRLVSISLSLRWAAFIAIWVTTCLAPLYKLWGLGYDLEGGRFCFFLTMPLSLLPTTLILLQGKKRFLAPRIDKALSSIGISSTMLITLILGKAAYITNLDWVHAGHEVRECTKQASAVSSKCVDHEKILILGIPKRHGGAHMMLNGNTFTTALKPPFMSSDYSGPIVTFDPIQFSEQPQLNSDRFKRLSREGNKLMVWNSDKRAFETVNFNTAERALPALSLSNTQAGYTHRLGGVKAKLELAPEAVVFDNIAEGDSLAFSNLNLNPLSADFLEVKLQALDDQPQPLSLRVSLDDKTTSLAKSNNTNALNQSSTLRIPLSRDWRWYSKPTHDSIFLLLPPGRKVAIRDCKLLATAEVAPVLKSSLPESYEGITEINSKTLQSANQTIDLQLYLPPLKDIKTLQIEISKPNTFYDNFPADYGDAAVMEKQCLPALSPVAEQNMKVSTANLSHGLFYQLRVRLLDKNGSKVGEVSNPTTIKISD